LIIKIRKNRKTQKIVISLCLLRPCLFRVLWCSVCFCTGHFFMVPINLTCPHCLQHFFFEHLLHLYYFNLLQLVLSACVTAVQSHSVLHNCAVVLFWSSVIMDCFLFTFENRVPLMLFGASVVWHTSLPLMNSFKKSRLLFSYSGCDSRGFCLSAVFCFPVHQFFIYTNNGVIWMYWQSNRKYSFLFMSFIMCQLLIV